MSNMTKASLEVRLKEHGIDCAESESQRTRGSQWLPCATIGQNNATWLAIAQAQDAMPPQSCSAKLPSPPSGGRCCLAGTVLACTPQPHCLSWLHCLWLSMICSLRRLTQLFSLNRKCLATCPGKLLGKLLVIFVIFAMLKSGF